MSKKEKLKDRVLSVPSDLKWSEFATFMRHYGYIVLDNKSGSSHCKFYNRDSDTLINSHKPHNPKIVQKHIIEQTIKQLKEGGDL